MSKNVSDSTPDDPVFTAVELQTLEKLNAETRAWIQLVTENQKQKKDHETPAFTTSEVETKMADLDREIKYLINKAKIHKPKPKAENPKEESKPKEEEAPKTEEAGADEKTIPPTATPETPTEAKPAEEKPAEEAPPPIEKPTEEKPEKVEEQAGEKSDTENPDTHKPDDELWSVGADIVKFFAHVLIF